MSRTDWSIFNIETGALLPYTYPGDRSYAEQNAPEGHAVIEGQFDHRRQRVAMEPSESGELVSTIVEYVPDRPADDELHTWAWDAEAWRWQSVPTLLAQQRQRAAEVKAQIDAIEAEQARPQRELLNALLAGTPPPAEAQQRLQEVEAAIVPLRQLRAAILATTTVEDLAAL